MQETELYEPIKTFLEAQGYEVKAEVQGCDVVACRNEEPPLIVEMKTGLTITLLMQGVNRLAISDAVYVAIPRGKGLRWKTTLRDGGKLCRRLGLGLMSVRTGKSPLVEVHFDPAPYKPRPSKMRKTLLLREFHKRAGDPNTGGQTGRPVVTAYRQDCLRIASALAETGPQRPVALRDGLGIDKAPAMLQRDVYGWFHRIERGIYDLADPGKEALQTYEDVVSAFEK